MRNYQILDAATVEAENVLRLGSTEDNPEKPCLHMSREGSFLSLSASFGPFEIALRLNYDDFKRRVERLHPVPGLATTLQVGTANSYIALGLTKDGRLVMRPTVVTDASGHITLNLVGSATTYDAVRNWLGIEYA